MERVDSAEEFGEAVQVYNLTQAEFNVSAFTNDLRMGTLPERNVKATEVVSANQSITGVMNGIVKVVEGEGWEGWCSPGLNLAWLTMAQHMNDMDTKQVQAILGDKAKKIANLSNEEIFAETAQGLKFRVFGLSTTLNKMQDYRKLTSLLQTVSGSEGLLAAFMQAYSLPKFLGEIIKSLDIDIDKIANNGPASSSNDGVSQAQPVPPAQPGPQVPGQPGAAGQPAPPKPGMAVDQSQIPQASAGRNIQTGNAVPRPQILSGGLTTPGGR